MKERIISFFLVISMLVCCGTVCYADESVSPFTDVDSDAWYYDEVIGAYNEGIMVGTSKDKFEPDAVMTREMFVTALLRTFDIDATEILENYYGGMRTGFFYDVEDKWYADSVCWAAQEDVRIVAGIGKNEKGFKIFGVGMPVSRQDMATFVSRVLERYYLTLPDDADASKEFKDEISDYAKEAVEVLRKSGIVHGTDDGVFSAKKNSTRAEVAAILFRLHNKLKNASARFDFDTEDACSFAYRDSADETNEYVSFTDKQLVDEFVRALNSFEMTAALRMDAKEFTERYTDYYVFMPGFRINGYYDNTAIIVTKGDDAVYLYRDSYRYTVTAGTLKQFIDTFVI